MKRKINKLERVLINLGFITAITISPINAQINEFAYNPEMQYEDIPLKYDTKLKKVKNIKIANIQKEQSSKLREEVRPIISGLKPDYIDFSFDSKKEFIESINNLGKIKYFTSNEKGNMISFVITKNDTDQLYIANYLNNNLKKVSLNFNDGLNNLQTEPNITKIEGISMSKDNKGIAIVSNQYGGMIANYMLRENFMKMYKFENKKFSKPSISNFIKINSGEKNVNFDDEIKISLPVISVIDDEKKLYVMSVFDENLYKISKPGEKCLDAKILKDGFRISYLNEIKGKRSFNILNYFDIKNMNKELNESISLNVYQIGEGFLSEDGKKAVITTHLENPFREGELSKGNNVLEVDLNKYDNKRNVLPTAINLTQQNLFSLNITNSNFKYNFKYNVQISNDGIVTYVNFNNQTGRHSLEVQKGEYSETIYSSGVPIKYELDANGKIINGFSGREIFHEQTLPKIK
ncbi:MAG: hypothetical protein U9Q99_02905 [Nanoarchaeota archaeon]|nr:hypothetical protein [Nanoarchaeota archaeon]